MKQFITDLFNTYEGNYQSIKSSISKDECLKNKIKDSSGFLPQEANFSQRLFHLVNDFTTIPKCILCKEKESSFLGFTKGYSKFCGRICARRSNMTVNQKLSNSEESRKKKKQTLQEKYGVENIFQTKVVQNIIKEKRHDIEDQRKRTNLERYGVEHAIQNGDIKAKVELSNMVKFGVKYLLSLPEIRILGKEKLNSKEVKNKRKQTNLERYGVEYSIHLYDFYNRYFGENGKYNSIISPLFEKKEYLGCDRRNLYKFKCNECFSIFEDHLADGHIPRCLMCYPYSIYNTYSSENFFSNYLKSFGLRIHRRDRKQITPLEIDFYLPDLKIGIEFNELRSHSEIGNDKIRKYHLNKTEKCLEKGIQLIHIFQDEWFFKQKIVKSIILSKLGLIQNKIYGRNTEFKEVSKNESFLFLKINHLQGTEKHIKRYFGLYFNQELIQLIGIGKSRYNKNYDYELIRSCTKLNTIIIGGFEKLMKNLPLQGSIISYVDRRYFNGNSYKNWDFIGKTSPNYFYCDKKYQQRMSRLKFQKHKLIHSKKDLTEWEIMQLAGYDRIWDCGNLVYSRTLP